MEEWPRRILHVGEGLGGENEHDGSRSEIAGAEVDSRFRVDSDSGIREPDHASFTSIGEVEIEPSRHSEDHTFGGYGMSGALETGGYVEDVEGPLQSKREPLKMVERNGSASMIAMDGKAQPNDTVDDWLSVQIHWCLGNGLG